MRQTTSEIINASVTNILTVAQKEVKEKATDLLIDEALKYRTLLENQTMWHIFETCSFRRWHLIYKMRNHLWYKAQLLEHMAGLIYDIK